MQCPVCWMSLVGSSMTSSGFPQRFPSAASLLHWSQSKQDLLLAKHTKDSSLDENTCPDTRSAMTSPQQIAPCFEPYLQLHSVWYPALQWRICIAWRMGRVQHHLSKLCSNHVAKGSSALDTLLCWEHQAQRSSAN